MRIVLAAAAVASLAGAARAEVVESQAHGFQVKSTVEIAAEPEAVWKALTRDVGRWWHPQHTWSGDAKNLSIKARPGGCFCEKMPKGGGMQHMTVNYVVPNQGLHMTGQLGPLHMEGAGGGLLWDLKPSGEGTTLTLTYTVGGFAAGGLKKWEKPVDMVLGEQLKRLERYVETGKPD
ncbi:MAG TPA: SRPBCC domain-containing protein [Caulobacteraceae bacterium]|nr:SRPBCC domain-containing protein [Caulobacteraceae bacterium]